jgi:hypothetical protein
MERTSDNTPWPDTPFIELPIFVANCPACGAVEHEITRTKSNGDGTSTRKATCQACGRRYRIVISVEPLPAAGKWTLP